MDCRCCDFAAPSISPSLGPSPEPVAQGEALRPFPHHQTTRHARTIPPTRQSLRQSPPGSIPTRINLPRTPRMPTLALNIRHPLHRLALHAAILLLRLTRTIRMRTLMSSHISSFPNRPLLFTTHSRLAFPLSFPKNRNHLPVNRRWIDSRLSIIPARPGHNHPAFALSPSPSNGTPKAPTSRTGISLRRHQASLIRVAGSGKRLSFNPSTRPATADVTHHFCPRCQPH